MENNEKKKTITIGESGASSDFLDCCIEGCTEKAIRQCEVDECFFEVCQIHSEKVEWKTCEHCNVAMYPTKHFPFGATFFAKCFPRPCEICESDRCDDEEFFICGECYERNKITKCSDCTNAEEDRRAFKLWNYFIAGADCIDCGKELFMCPLRGCGVGLCPSRCHQNYPSNCHHRGL